MTEPQQQSAAARRQFLCCLLLMIWLTSSAQSNEKVLSANTTLPHEAKPDDETSKLDTSEDNLNSNAGNKTSHVDERAYEEDDISQSALNSSNTLPKDDGKPKQQTPKYDDEQTYLDLFGERAKELLTQHIIPTTDSICRWDWRMGRCEPYCECGYYFLWGDYHLGRSCRLRSKFISIQSQEVKTSAASLEDAWQQWADHMDDPDAFASFVDSGNEAKKSQHEVNECSLPPESRYTQGVYYLTKLLGHGTIVFHHFKKAKHHAVRLAAEAATHGKVKFNRSRENACTGLKRMIEERERERNQPVVLTKRGSIWIRRLCGTGNNTAVQHSMEDQDQASIIDECSNHECT
ncbi:hypothetical protein ACHAXN_009563 [Cyclotella atomus]